ncbi:MAG: alpha/beta hydrolase [Chlorobi bacterium]|nr:alpha/beta hydrolase [Chlorobiota bacterium]
MNLKLLSLFFIAIILSFNTSAQHTKRPKIGVVLSGGGAKGIAHIGILKALEEEGIRPDYIVGTSMGSIIGGLYSLGYSADQLDSIIRAIDWNLVLSNNIPFNYVAFEEKLYYNRYLVSLSFKDGKLNIPSGMIEGQMLSQVLNRYTWPAMKYDNFDEFPIPFRCIATDVSTGEQIVFKDGPLSEALRASMAIPTVFTAADLDSTLAVDGGILNNFPVDKVIDMGADIVIGINVSDEGLVNAKELGSMMGILMQVAMFPSLKKVKEDIKKCDIYIKPDLQEYSTGSFSSYSEILRLGYIAGEKARPEFHNLAQKINARTSPPSGTSLSANPICISAIKLKGNKYVSDKLILGKLGILPGDTVSRRQIENGINRIFGTNAFKKVSYQIEKTPNQNKYNLTVKIIEEQPASVKASVHYDNLFSAGLVINNTLRNLVGRSSRLIVEGDISQSPKARVSYLKYLGKRQRFAGLFKYSFLNEQVPEYDNGKLNDIETSVYHEFLFGVMLAQSLRNSIYFGLNYKTGKEKLKFWSDYPEGIKNMKIKQLRYDLFYNYNTMNDRNYPTNGSEIRIYASLFFHNDYKMNYESDVDTVYFDDGYGNPIPLTEDEFNSYITESLTPNSYTKVQINYLQYFNLRRNLQIIPSISGGFTFSNANNGLFDNFKIGGNQMVNPEDVTFFGLNYSEIQTENFLSGGVYLQNILLNNFYVKYGINYLLHHPYVPFNDLTQFDITDKNTLFGYGMKITYKSLFGPVSLGLSSNTKDNVLRWYVGIGYSFNYKD